MSAKYPAVLSAQLKLLEALKRIVDATDEYRDTKINQTEPDAPCLELTAKNGAVFTLSAGLESVSAELGIGFSSQEALDHSHSLDPHIKQAYQDAFQGAVPTFPNAC